MKRLSRLRLIPTNFNHQTKELLDNSTIHGVRYMNEKGRVFGEKLLWFSCVVIGFVSALVIIDSLWEKFQTNPTITGLPPFLRGEKKENLIIFWSLCAHVVRNDNENIFSLLPSGLDTDFHNQEFTFPTFAICPNHASDPDKVNQTAQSIASDDDDYELYIPFLEALPKLTYDEMSKAWMKFTTSIGQTKFNRMKEIALRQLIFNVSLNCEDFFDECRFRDDPIKCCEHFTPAYNEHGFCFSFNGRYESSGFSEWVLIRLLLTWKVQVRNDKLIKILGIAFLPCCSTWLMTSNDPERGWTKAMSFLKPTDAGNCKQSSKAKQKPFFIRPMM